jgi:DNA-binding GntR family transcriptional regulator
MSLAKSKPPLKYKKLAETLIKRIESGRLSIGDKMPGELGLVAKYKVSRFTVRAAMQVLEQMGMVSRDRGRGTVVTSQRPFRMYQQTIRTFADMTEFPVNEKRQRVSKETVQAQQSLAKFLGCDAGTKWILYSMIRTHSSHPLPLCWQDIYMRPSLEQYCKWIPTEEGVGTAKEYAILNSNWRQTIVDVMAEEISEDMADALQVAAGTAALVAKWRYLDSDDVPYCVGVRHYPAERFMYSFKHA